MKLPYGLCDVTYNGITYKNLASESTFNAEPTYEILKGGIGKKFYFLTDYQVSLDIELNEENYDTLKLSNPALKDYNNGLYDKPTNVNPVGKLLTIHPVDAGHNKKYDITIFKAIIDPEKGFDRTFGKELDTIKVRFIGKPAKNINREIFKSYFFIGDLDQAGVSL
ncbi:hypothetical protein [Gracilibacillus saliphilus]|uniref:hypothetical protein n=1 Tax=Gracilibacillus saliphilus TaxID=543890 RepID=UPI0013D584A7|nr:hypothetical protein [Gracilibacillus saliphilus]